MSSGVALAILASVLTVTFTVLALIRMRRTFDEPVGRSGPGPGMELGTDTRPTLVPDRTTATQPLRPAGVGLADGLATQPMKPPPPKKKSSGKGTGSSKSGQAYVASQEDEDDVPTTLYRKDDDPDVEALLAEFDNEDGKRR